MKIKNIKTIIETHSVMAKIPREVGEYNCPTCDKLLTARKDDNGLHWEKTHKSREHEKACELETKYNLREVNSCLNCKRGGYTTYHEDVADVYCREHKQNMFYSNDYSCVETSNICDLYERDDEE